MEKIKIAIIGGTGFEKLFLGKNARQMRLKTQYGPASPVLTGKIAFLLRHGLQHSVPPHKINYHANIYALHKMGVEQVIAVNAVGAINSNLKVSDIILPHDFVDFTKSRCMTFYDDSPVTHIDVSQPYCPELRKLIIETARKLKLQLQERAVMVCTEGPRFETPAEIEMFRRLGCDIVGMTGVPEAVLARELEMCYAAVCYVSNMAAGIQERLTTFEVSKACKEVVSKLEQLLIGTVKNLPLRCGENCPCVNALRSARFK